MAETGELIPTLTVLRAQRDEILALATKYGVSNVQVFGSVARDEAEPGSDIDLLVTASRDISVFDLVGLWLDLQDLLQREVSLVTETDLPVLRAIVEAVLAGLNETDEAQSAEPE
jgi:hypothetical protein